ncbi:PilC/PilY family type IV pilus protein [Acinetobacter sp. RF14B]|uniref:PilC/PilY family type IV pilus protein n=1 Tax=Acinetobacter sp. RF14B TaxID=2650965 RepID=UPI0011674328|nr:PilC/PilY family type IV pilus protein [Acinetobacter sp. RF14B]TQR63471.1 pilus assembly protein PilY [Acinetobacter sp. RF14B]
MKPLKNNFLSSYGYKVLVASITTLSTVVITTSVTQASDIDIYQDAKSGDVTLMFMLDVSGSMTGSGSYDGTGQARITRLKTAMNDLLNGNASKGITKLADDKIIGLSTLGSPKNTESGAVLVPARRLNEIVTTGQECSGKGSNQTCKDVTQLQREILWNKINSLSANSNTPTGRSYATTIAYLMGTSTKNYTDGGWGESDELTKSGNNYSSPTSLTQTDEIKKCSGQGVYVLTDGEPNKGTNTDLSRAAIGKSSFPNCTGTSPGWDCIGKLNSALLDPTKNAKGLKFKTAVVGFGNSFNSIPKYDPTKSQAENLAPFLDKNGNKKTNLTNVQEAAYWGIIGEGGWYPGNSSQDIVESVNDFISNLSKDIPSVTTGSPTIPRDALNPAELQDDAYYQTFQPTPNTNYQLWLGNLKKFKVDVNGILKGQGGSRVFNTNGSLVEPTYDANGNITSAVYDYWAKAIDTSVANGDENTVGSRKFAARGGAWSQLLLGAKADNQTAQRKLLTNRRATVTGASTVFGGSGNLRQVQLTDLSDSTYKNDPNRGYLVSLLGYNIDVNSPPTTVANLITQPALRQMGAVMHSYPVIVTNKGKLSYNKTNRVMESTNREDYILFGTTQGLLHVVDANTGVEKFAFVPNEMVENQKDAFRPSNVTTGGMQKLFYGIDGAWALDTRYVVDASGNLTVGNGRTTSQKGWQIAYGGLRMGGRSYYALDLSDINSPTLKFHIDPATQKVYSGSSSKSFSELQYMGQSWSKPSIAWVNWGGVRKRVMFVGGGYDAGGDDGDARTNGVKGLYEGYESHIYNQPNKKGAGVYMFDADNGDLLWWASANASSTSAVTTESGVIATQHNDLKYSVASQIRTVDRDGDDLVDHLYFGDLGGQVFRIDLDNKQGKIGAVPKTPVRLLNLNAAEKSPRFYDMPSFSLYNAGGETFALISIGSGNRSEPLRDYTTTTAGYDYDSIYNVYDKDVARRDLFNRAATAPLKTESVIKTQLGEITDSNRFSTTNPVAPYSGKGWFYRFQNCTAGVDGALTNCSSYKKQSEKVFGTPLVMNYKLYVSTFDASKPGISGDCGAGVKGESMITAFCLPYGQCASKPADSRAVIGVGIHTVTVGGQDDGGSRNPDCEGDSCPPVTCGDEACPPEAKGDSSAKNYCIQTSGRIALTVTGGFGGGEATEMCLIPQRWYEKLALKN